MELYFNWIQGHILSIVSFGLAGILMFHYLIEKDTGFKLSKRYRNSIFETQSKSFMNAARYLVEGKRDMAIDEFANAIDINREAIEVYFALGSLYRLNGETEKAISIHRNLIARQNISESTRLNALKELAIDFDKGGFVDKAIETYKDVLKVNRDQYEVIQALCRIYENIQDWDQAYNYRVMMGKVGYESQAETISHILVQKAKVFFKNGEFTKCREDLEDAFRFAPSLSAKILQLRLSLVSGESALAQQQFFEIIKEHPEYTVFIFESFREDFKSDSSVGKKYFGELGKLEMFFLEMEDEELSLFPSIVLAKVKIWKRERRLEKVYGIMNRFIQNTRSPISETLKIEYIRILINLDKKDQAIAQMRNLVENINKSLAKHYCRHCNYGSDEIFWRCPQCHSWETIQFRWKV